MKKTACLVLMLGWFQPISADTIKSEKYPLLIHYDKSYEEKAKSLLTAVEDAWHYNTEVLDLPPPPPDDGANGSDDYDVFLTNTPYQAHTQHVASEVDRRWGRASKIIIDADAIPSWSYPLVLSHEFHHAVQLGMCKVGYNIAEAGAVYASGLHVKGKGWHLSYFLGFNAFQDNPERSIDWEGALGDFYPYGGALYLMFLDQVYGDGEGGMLSKIYNGIYEPESPGEHCPYYLDVISGLVDFDEAFKTFVRWRYFIGVDEDDGHHFKNLTDWDDPQDPQLHSVALSRDHASIELPLTDVAVEKGVMPYGASYVRLSLAGLAAADRVRLDFAGDPTTRWTVQAMVLDDTEAPIEVSVESDDAGKARVDLLVGDRQTAVLVFANLGDGNYQPAGSGWKESLLTYSLTRLGPPEIESVAPRTLIAGSTTPIVIKGKRFSTTAPKVTFSDPGVTAKDVKVGNDGELEVLALVGRGATKGPLALTLQWNGLEATTTLDVKELDTEEEEEEPAIGAGCVVGSDPVEPLSLTLLLGIALLLRRARYVTSCALVALVIGCGSDKSHSDSGTTDDQSVVPLDASLERTRDQLPDRVIGRDQTREDHAVLPLDMQSKPDLSTDLFGKACSEHADCGGDAPFCMKLLWEEGAPDPDVGYCTHSCVTSDPSSCAPPSAGSMPVCGIEHVDTSTVYCIFLCEIDQKTWSCPTDLSCGDLRSDGLGGELRVCE